jgi:hypothetical protein
MTSLRGEPREEGQLETELEEGEPGRGRNGDDASGSMWTIDFEQNNEQISLDEYVSPPLKHDTIGDYGSDSHFKIHIGESGESEESDPIIVRLLCF